MCRMRRWTGIRIAPGRAYPLALSSKPTNRTNRVLHRVSEGRLPVAITPSAVAQRVFVCFLLLVYAGLLHWGYVAIVVPSFNYLGYHTFPRPLLEMAVIYCLVILPGLFMRVHLAKPSDLVMFYTVTFVYVPALVVSAVGSSLSFPRLLGLALWLVCGLLLLALIGVVPLLKVRRIQVSHRGWWLLICASGGLCVAYLIASFGLRPPPLFLFASDIYALRLEAREWGAAAGYALRFTGNVFAPILIAYGLTYARWLILLCGICTQVLVFSFDGTKSTLLSPLLILFIWMMLKYRLDYKGFVISIIALILLGIAIDQLLTTPWISSLVLRRAIITPGLLTAIYYDFFQSNEPFVWSHSFLRFVVVNPYPASPAFVIGKHYFGDPETSANVHFLGDGIANLGAPGVAVVAMVAAIFLWIMDSVSRGKEQFAIAAFAMPGIALVNSSLTTSLVTHGLIAMTFFVWLFTKSGERK